MLSAVSTLALVISITGSANRFSAARGQSRDINQEQEDIRQVIVRYCQFAKKKDFDEVKKLVIRTPDFYWTRGERAQVPETNVVGRQNHSGSGIETISMSNSDLADMHLAYISDGFLRYSQALIIPKPEEISVRSDFKYALARTTLSYETNLTFPQDFLLVKEGETWKIFNITYTNEKETFPID